MRPSSNMNSSHFNNNTNGTLGYRPPLSANNTGKPDSWSTPITSGMEDEHEKLNVELQKKVSSLRSLSIRIGDEVREHNSFLGDMAGAFDRSEGVLRSTMTRVLGLRRHSSSSALYCYLLCFATLVFFACWFLLRWRW